MAGVTGKCHLCKEIKDTIKFCPHCAHWFCDDCRRNWWERTKEAGKQLIWGKQPGCCGPLEEK